jgi:hypothetical protein
MSSVVIWKDEATGVTASWNKQGPHTVFVPLRIDDQGICDGITTEWRGEKAAMRAAKIAAKERLEEMSSEDPALKRFRVFAQADASGDGVYELRDLAWFGDDRHFDAAALAGIGTLPVGGTFQTTSQGRTVTVQRVS